jgi:hypothetical protein
MRRRVLGFVALACMVVVTASAADVARPEDDSKREPPLAASSNSAAKPIPQMAPNTNLGPEVPMARETNPAAAPVGQVEPLAARPRNTVRMILAVLVVLLGSHFLKRWLSRSGPS